MKKRNNRLFILMCFILLGANLCKSQPIYASAAEAKLSDVPRVVVTGYNIKSGSVVPGQDFELELLLQNTSLYSSVYSVLVTISMSNTGIYPADGSSNQQFIEKIKPQQEEKFIFPLEVAKEMKDANTKINVTIEFADINYGLLSNDVNIVLPISSECLLDAQISVAASAMQNSNSLVNVKLENVGMENIYNIILHIDGSISEEYKINNFGMLDTGGQLIKDYYVTFLEIGEQDITSYFTYEDKDGKLYTSDTMKDIVKVEAYAYQEDGDSEEIDYSVKSKSMSLLEISLIGIIGISIVAVAILLVRKKR